MAELKDFINSVLTDICEGVQQATARIEELGGVVNPRALSSSSPIETYTRRSIINVAFDVSVEAQTGSGNRGRVGVLIATIGMGTERESAEAQRSANSVRFTVPLVLPVDPARVRGEHAQEEQELRRITQQIADR